MATVADIDIFGVEALPQVRVIVINGTLDESNLDELKNKVDPLVVDQQISCLIFNCKDLKYMNSKIVGYFASTYSQMAEKGGKMIMAENNETISDIISMVGLNMIIEQAATMEDALGIAGNVAIPAIPTPSTAMQQAVAVEPPPATTSSEPPVEEARAESSLPIEPPAVLDPPPNVPPMPSKFPVVEQTASQEPPVSPDPLPLQNQPASSPMLAEAVVPPASVPAPEAVKSEPVVPVSPKTIPDPTRKTPAAPTPIETKPEPKPAAPASTSDEVVVMLELPKDMEGDGGETYMTGDGNISARILTDSLGRHIEIRFKPGKYFFKGKHDAPSKSSTNPAPKQEEEHPKKSFFGGLFGKK